MNSWIHGTRFTAAWLAAGSVAAVVGPAWGQLRPYTADAHTLHLWHFDEPDSEVGTLPEFSTFEATTGFSFFDLSIENGAKLEAPSFSAALGGALDTRGIPGSAPLQAGAFGFEDLILVSDLVGANGAFTFEALVSPDFDPSGPIPGRTAPMQIVSMENVGDDGDSLFHFRLVPPVSNGPWRLDFATVDSAPSAFAAPLPIAGPHAAVQGRWYHVAVSYTGQEDTDGNLRLYWTDLARGAAQAALLGSFRMSNDLGSAGSGDQTGDFTIGNVARDVPGEAFHGRIDEVRISGIARAPTAFSLSGAPYTGDANTKLLYHLNEPNPEDFPAALANLAFDDGMGAPTHLNVRDGALLGAPAYSAAFGAALDTSGAATAGAFAQKDLPLGAFINDNTGSFTFEALVNIGFDPASTTLGTDGYSQILSMENDGGRTERPMHFKLVPPVAAGGPINLEFINIAAPSADLHFLSPLPSTGPHAAVQGHWFHVAVTYTGDTNATDNLVMYWTAMDGGAATANVLGTHTMAERLAGNTGNFVVGNEGRSTGGITDHFFGLIDEVRISRVARAPSEFLFTDLAAMPEIVAIAVDKGAGTVGLTWNSEAGATYRINRSVDLVTFTPVKAGIASEGAETSDAVPMGDGDVELFQIETE